jgi:hypothetical protein
MVERAEAPGRDLDQDEERYQGGQEDFGGKTHVGS